MRKRRRAVTDGVFGIGFHLPKALGIAIGNENRIIAEPLVATAGEDKLPMHLPDKGFAMPVRPGQRQGADEIGAPVLLCCAPVKKFTFDPRHGDSEILVRPGPAGGIDPRRPVKRHHTQARIVGQRGQPRGLRRGTGFQLCIFGKCLTGFLGLGQAKLAR